MTLNQKIQKAFQRRTYTQSSLAKMIKTPRQAFQTWRAALAKQRTDLRRRNLTVENILRRVDRNELEQIRARYSNVDGRPDVFWTKYLDYNKWLAQNIRYANDLGLVAKPPRRVLDLGCGGGYFLSVCRHLGSQVVGLDLNKDLVLNEMIAAFKLHRVTWRIRSFVKLPSFKHKFDLITAWMICFNFPPNRTPWSAAEWDFLLTDVASRLTPKGIAIFSLNANPEDGVLYDDELKQLFESRGAVIEGKRLTFKRDDLVRTVGKLRREKLAAAAVPAAPAAIAG